MNFEKYVRDMLAHLDERINDINDELRQSLEEIKKISRERGQL